MKKIITASILSLFITCSAYADFGLDIGKSLLGNKLGVSSSQIDSAVKVTKQVSKAAEGLTLEQEYYLGRSVSAKILSQYKPYNNKAANDYVSKVGLVLAANSSRPITYGGYHFQILDSNEVNAFAAPGGFIFVTRGMLKLMPSEDALAGVLAHEIGHIVEEHGKNAISQANLSSAALTVGKEVAASQGNGNVQQLTSAFGGGVEDVCNTMMTKGYSRGQEYDADKYAASLLKKSGYDPTGIASMLNQLETASAGGGGMFSTHPKPKDRHKKVKKSLKRSGQSGKDLRTARFLAVKDQF